jgi:hypothetical protein
LTSKPSQLRKSQLDKLLKAFGISKKNSKAETQAPHNLSKGQKVVTVYAISGRLKSMNRIEYVKSLTDFKYFSTGEFLADIDRKRYQDLLEKISSVSKTIFPDQSKVIDKRQVNLVHLFSNLYNFRLSVYHMFQYSYSRKMQEEFSIEDDYSLHLRQKFMETMNANLSEVDKTLCLLIDPEKRKFKEDEIDFSTYDFVALDKEWENSLRK